MVPSALIDENHAYSNMNILPKKPGALQSGLLEMSVLQAVPFEVEAAVKSEKPFPNGREEMYPYENIDE